MLLNYRKVCWCAPKVCIVPGSITLPLLTPPKVNKASVFAIKHNLMICKYILHWV